MKFNWNFLQILNQNLIRRWIELLSIVCWWFKLSPILVIQTLTYTGDSNSHLYWSCWWHTTWRLLCGRSCCCGCGHPGTGDGVCMKRAGFVWASSSSRYIWTWWTNHSFHIGNCSRIQWHQSNFLKKKSYWKQ